jgi:hypothetical protein
MREGSPRRPPSAGVLAETKSPRPEGQKRWMGMDETHARVSGFGKPANDFGKSARLLHIYLTEIPRIWQTKCYGKSAGANDAGVRFARAQTGGTDKRSCPLVQKPHVKRSAFEYRLLLVHACCPVPFMKRLMTMRPSAPCTQGSACINSLCNAHIGRVPSWR